MRVLLVDDDPDILDSTSGLLETEGHEVVAVAKAAEVLPALAARTFDVLLQDVNMPGLHIDGLVRDVRAAAPGLPIVLFTAAADGEETLRRLGVEGLLKKPFDARRLVSVLQTFGGGPLT